MESPPKGDTLAPVPKLNLGAAAVVEEAAEGACGDANEVSEGAPAEPNPLPLEAPSEANGDAEAAESLPKPEVVNALDDACDSVPDKEALV